MNRLVLYVLLVSHASIVSAHPHLAQNIPDFAAQPTVESISDGAWVDPATWSRGVVPGSADIVRVKHAVTISSVDIAWCLSLGVSGRLDDSGKLLVKDLLVYAEGTLVLQPGCEIVIRDLPTDPVHDPEQFGTGVLVLGKFYALGQFKTPFLRATGDVTGSTISVTGDTTGWDADDEILVPDTDNVDMIRNERGTLSGSSGGSDGGSGGGSIVMAGALQYVHPAAHDADGQFVAGCPVINLTRSILIRSENPAGTRGHTLYTGTADVALRGVQFQGLGRTKMIGFGGVIFNTDGSVKSLPASQIGRYGVHFHHCVGPALAVGPQFSMVGCVVDGGDVEFGLRWGTAVHQSHYGLIADNVFWGKSFDGNLVTEDGNETGNLFARNIAGGGRVGFWFYGFGGNTIVDNVAVACVAGTISTRSDGQGIALGWGDFRSARGSAPHTVNVPAFQGQPKSDWPLRKYRDLAVARFAGNEAISSDSGLTPWTMCQRNPPYGAPGTPAFLAEDQLIWHCRSGALSYYEGEMILTGLRIYGDPKWALLNSKPGFPTFGGRTTGIGAAARGGEKITVRDAVLHNLGWGIHSRLSGDVITTATYERCEFRCYIGIERELFCQQPDGVDTYVIDCTFGSPAPTIRQTGQFWIKSHSASGGTVFGARDSFHVQGLNGDPTDTFDLYYAEQVPTFLFSSKYPGAPASYYGLTVQQVSDQFGLKLAGAIAPNTAVARPHILGLCEPITP